MAHRAVGIRKKQKQDKIMFGFEYVLFFGGVAAIGGIARLLKMQKEDKQKLDGYHEGIQDGNAKREDRRRPNICDDDGVVSIS